MAIKSTSVMDELRKLDEEEARINAQRAKLKESAKAEAMEKANAAVEELNSLGFNYRLVDGDVGFTRAANKPKGQRKTDPNKVCPICDFITDPPHDARKHRSQGDNKRPFTAEELTSMDLKKVS